MAEFAKILNAQEPKLFSENLVTKIKLQLLGKQTGFIIPFKLKMTT
jgi:hypothetical protein